MNLVDCIRDRISEYNAIRHILKTHPGLEDAELRVHAIQGDLKKFKKRFVEITKGYEAMSRGDLRILAKGIGVVDFWNKSKAQLIMEILDNDRTTSKYHPKG